MFIDHHELFGRGFNILSLESLEASLGDLDVGHEGVQLVDAVLVLVPEPGEPNPHPEHQDVRTPLPTAWVKHVYRKNILPQQPQHTKGAFAQLLRLGLSSEVSYVITKQW